MRQLKKVELLRVYYRDKLRGEVILKLLCNPDRRGELDRIRSQDLNAGKPHRIIENDAVSTFWVFTGHPPYSPFLQCAPDI